MADANKIARKKRRSTFFKPGTRGRATGLDIDPKRVKIGADGLPDVGLFFDSDSEHAPDTPMPDESEESERESAPPTVTATGKAVTPKTLQAAPSVAREPPPPEQATAESPRKRLSFSPERDREQQPVIEDTPDRGPASKATRSAAQAERTKRQSAPTLAVEEAEPAADDAPEARQAAASPRGKRKSTAASVTASASPPPPPPPPGTPGRTRRSLAPSAAAPTAAASHRLATEPAADNPPSPATRRSLAPPAAARRSAVEPVAARSPPSPAARKSTLAAPRSDAASPPTDPPPTHGPAAARKSLAAAAETTQHAPSRKSVAPAPAPAEAPSQPSRKSVVAASSPPPTAAAARRSVAAAPAAPAGDAARGDASPGAHDANDYYDTGAPDGYDDEPVQHDLPADKGRDGADRASIHSERADAAQAGPASKRKQKGKESVADKPSNTEGGAHAGDEANGAEEPSTPPPPPPKVRKPKAKAQKRPAEHFSDDDQDDDADVRRGKRNRIKPVQYWKNERALYTPLRTESALRGLSVFKGVQSGTKTPVARPAKRHGQQHQRKKIAHKDGSEDESQREERRATEDDYTGEVQSSLAVLDWTPGAPEGSATDIACVRGAADIAYQSPSDGLHICKVFSLRNARWSSGLLKIDPGVTKEPQLSRDNFLSFYVVHGRVELTLHTSVTVVGTGCAFFVPPQNRYGLRNIGKNVCKLSYTQIKLPPTAASPS